MDITTIKHVSLCTGYAGIDLGLKRVIPGIRTIAYSEIEGYACTNLVAKIESGQLDAAPIWSDLKTFPYRSFYNKVHILSGGYPCQPFSNAGKRSGTDDSRHLWPYIADGIRAMQPSVCFFENVEGHITLGLREVIGELEQIGYDTTWGIFSASEVGAPHQRKRIFILGYAKHLRHITSEITARISERIQTQAESYNAKQFEGSDSGNAGQELLAYAEGKQPWEPSEWQGGKDISGGSKKTELAFSESKRVQGLRTSGIEESHAYVQQKVSLCNNHWPARPGEQQYDWEPPRTVKSKLGRNPNGSSNRVDRLRLLGNGVVPATAALAFVTLSQRLTNR
jgi:DNA (cytosine-5)-methyltransferase 1